MESTLTMLTSSHSLFTPHHHHSPLSSTHFSNLLFPISKRPSFSNFIIKASSTSNSNPTPPNTFISHLKSTTSALIFSVAAAAVGNNFRHLPARAEPPPPPPTLTQQQQEVEEVDTHENSPLTQFLESNSEAIEALKTLLQQKLEAGEDEEGLKILEKLSSAQPQETEWKFLMARLYNEMGKTQEAREVFEDILSKNPLLFEALFENALLMDKCGEGEGVLTRLERALGLAEAENKVKEARDVRLIMAQVQFLQKNVDEALRIYEELRKEDPKDFRPYFCKGMIYSLLDKNNEARQEFAKYRELSPKKFEVEGYLRTPLSRMKLFATDEDNAA